MARTEAVFEKRRQVLELRRAGMTFDEIAKRVGYANRGGARKAYESALADTGISPSPAQTRELELDRLDRLQVALWPKAVRGDIPAVDRVLRIGEQRLRLRATPEENTHELRNALEQSVAVATVTDADAALVEVGRKIADRIDEALAMGEGADTTRVLYLTPHFVNILRELLATPAARQAAGGAVKKKEGGGHLAQLRSLAGGASASAG